MKIIDPGHDYLLNNLDNTDKSRLRFVKRKGKQYPGNENAYPGTNMQEVMRALIDRCKYVNEQTPCLETESVIMHLQIAMLGLELRAARRHGRRLNFSSSSGIEEREVCEKCGHIGCTGECHS